MSKLPLPDRIFLIGMPGCGKSAVGKLVALSLQRTFIDLDKCIEEAEQKSIRDIFRSDGESYFRQQEREALYKTFSGINTVVACGGGTPCFFDNMEQMKLHGKVIYLQTDAETLAFRLKHGWESRPLFVNAEHLAMKEQLNTLLAARNPFYSQAHFTVDAAALPQQVAAEVMRVWQ